MNADITLNTLSFYLTKNGDLGSERRETSRGVNLPEVLTIRHQDYTDSKTKLPGVRTNVIHEMYGACADGRVVPVKTSLLVSVPSDVNITSAMALTGFTRLVNLLHGTTNTSGLDLGSSIIVSKQQ